MVRSVTPMISAASHHFRLPAIAFKITSCTFIIRSISADKTVCSGFTPSASHPVWPKISERVENMRFSMMDTGDNGQQMDAPVGIRYRPGESRTPSAERISRGGEPYSESAPPAGIPADQWREDYAG